jgi:hypothetical protein
MIRQYLLLFILLTLGAVGGSIVTYLNGQSDQEAHTGADPALPLQPSQQDRQNLTGDATPNEALLRRITALEQELGELKQQVRRFQANPTTEDTDTDIATASVSSPDATTAMIDGLIAAGIDAFTAEDIARRQSEIQLMRLELRDRATREGYLGTAQFRDEMRELRDSEVDLRNEVDEGAYDRYLYYTGQPNRISVDSVMLGSSAENNGIEPGDVLYRYEDKRIYTASDLRTATTQGERNEFVDITLIRQGNTVSLSIPRGPLGVRLTPVSINPSDTGG